MSEIAGVEGKLSHLEELSGLTDSEAVDKFNALKGQLAANEEELLTIK